MYQLSMELFKLFKFKNNRCVLKLSASAGVKQIIITRRENDFIIGRSNSAELRSVNSAELSKVYRNVAPFIEAMN